MGKLEQANELLREYRDELHEETKDRTEDGKITVRAAKADLELSKVAEIVCQINALMI